MKAFLFAVACMLGGYSQAQTYKFINGQWLDRSGFVSGTWFSQDGRLTQSAPARVDSIIDLDNGFVVPPFGEAHNHNVSAHNLATFSQLSNRYLRAGIFYVQNPNSLIEDRNELVRLKLINVPTSIDATFANGGLTSTDGHPTRFFQTSSPKGEGNFYHSIDTKEDLDAKWPAILAAKPDFIKTYLLFSDEYDQRRNNANFNGLRGLDPKILNQVVSRAHAAGLRVGVHVETAQDFHNAIASGADDIMHLPGFRGDPGIGLKLPPDFVRRFAISHEDAELARKNNVVVITTIGDTESVPFFYSLRRAADKLHAQNLKVLRDGQVRIAFGSDAYEKNSLIEVEYIAGLDVFSNAELVAMLCTSTPQAIFPSRKIGRIAEGYEASFVVLKKDPHKKIDAIEDIAHWVKSGKILDKQLR